MKPDDMPVIAPPPLLTARCKRIDMGEFRKITATAERWDQMLALLTVCRDSLDAGEHGELVGEIEKMLRSE